MKNIKIHAVQGSRASKQAGRLALAAVALAASIVSGGVHAQPVERASGAHASGRILVMPRAGLTDASMAKLLKENGGGNGRRVGKSELRIVDVPAGREAAMVRRLSQSPHVKFAELDMVVEPDLVTNDPYLGSQWHIPKIGADAAWDSSSGSNVTIAILDTGIDSAHPDLSGRLVPGWNVFDNNSNTADVHGHGTSVAGAAAASSNNGLGVAGVAGGARIMPIRISSLTGGATFSSMASGLTWAADNGARVANLSYRAAGSSSVLSAAAYMKSKGGLVFSSAGNNGVDEGFAKTTAMIPVSATTSGDVKASWSSYGDFVALSAPGEGIYTTTRGGGYGSASGTSFSSPISAGAAALVMSANPKLSSAEVETVLLSTAVDLGAAGRDNLYGHGRLNAAAAVLAAKGTVSTGDSSAPAASILAPLGSNTVTGLVPVDVGATDNVGVTKVELRINGSLLATDTTAPYGFSWDSTRVANGTATLEATAYDAAGNAGKSAAVSVNVSNGTVAPTDTTAPTASISAPLGGSTASGTVPVNVNASDNVGVAKVEVRVNGNLLGTDSTAPYSLSWDTTKLANGSASVVATAFDAAGNAGHSSAVTVTVANGTTTSGTSTDVTPPTASLSNPVNGSRLGGNVGVEGSASDNNGISGVTMTLRINGAVVATSTSSSKLKYGWQTRNVKAGSHVIELEARDAAGNTTRHSVTVYK